MKKTFASLFCLFVCFSFLSIAAYSAESLTGYFSPYADAYLYFTNRNMEKTLDPGLLEKVEKDKKEAALKDNAEEDEDEDDILSLFMTRFQDRDADVVFNLYVLSVEKEELVFEGVAVLSGNIPADLEAVREQCSRLKKINSAGQPESAPIYQYKDKKNGVCLNFTAVDSNSLHFRFDLNYDNPLPFCAYKPFKKKVEIPVDIREQTFVLGVRPESIARLIPSFQLDNTDFKKYMQGISSFLLTGKTEGKKLKTIVSAECLDEAKALEFNAQANEMIREVLPKSILNRFLSGVKCSNTGKTIRMDMDMELEETWDFMTNLTAGAVE